MLHIHLRLHSSYLPPRLMLHTRVSPLGLDEMRVIGKAQQRWLIMAAKIRSFPSQARKNGGEYRRFAVADKSCLSLGFFLNTVSGRLIGSVDAKCVARETFTHADAYSLWMHAAASGAGPTTVYPKGAFGTTLDKRAVTGNGCQHELRLPQPPCFRSR